MFYKQQPISNSQKRKKKSNKSSLSLKKLVNNQKLLNSKSLVIFLNKLSNYRRLVLLFVAYKT